MTSPNRFRAIAAAARDPSLSSADLDMHVWLHEHVSDEGLAALARANERPLERALDWLVLQGFMGFDPGASAYVVATPRATQLGAVLVTTKDMRITVAAVLQAFVNNQYGKEGLAVTLGCSQSSAWKVLKHMAALKLITKRGRKWQLSKTGMEHAERFTPPAADGTPQAS